MIKAMELREVRMYMPNIMLTTWPTSLTLKSQPK
jgi:hypothetical protein